MAALALAVSGPAFAKKKKASKKHKTPSSKSVGSDHQGSSGHGRRLRKRSEGRRGEDPGGEVLGREGPGGGPRPRRNPRRRRRRRRRPKTKPTAEEAPAGESGGFRAPALELVLGAGALFRNLSWNQNNTTTIAPYSLAPGPEAHLSLEVYPAAFATAGFVANVGIFGGFGYGFGVSSKAPDGTKLTTKFQDFLAGLKVRIPFGTFVPYVSVAYGGQGFRLDGQATIGVPATNYKFVRPGLGTRINISPTIDLDVGGGFLIVTDPGSASGEIASAALFPKAKANGIDAGLSVGFRVANLIALRAGADFRQYGLSLNVPAGSALLVGGATDRYIVGWGGVEIVLDGLGGGASSSSSSSSDEEKPAPPKKTKRRKQPEPEPGEDAAE